MSDKQRVAWVAVCTDGKQIPATSDFLFSDAAYQVAEHGGLKGMALVVVVDD